MENSHSPGRQADRMIVDINVTEHFACLRLREGMRKEE